MNKTIIFAVAALAILELSFAGMSRAEKVAEEIAQFEALLRELDLNAETQDGYAITAAEYARLKTAWQRLAQFDQRQLLGAKFWTGTFANMLFCDLHHDRTWQAHVNNTANYGQGARNLSLTLSRFNAPLTLAAARKTLVDLLHQESPMFRDGKLQISEALKAAAKQRAGREARRRLEAWEQLINARQKCQDMDKVRAVNEFFNRQITMKADKGTARGYDYWQSPIETLARGVGDCDDFAMAKYVSLRLLGIPAAQLRVAVVKGGFPYRHAVLFFFPQDEKDPWVLDNLAFEHLGVVASHVLPLSARMRRHGITPIYGLNENELTEFCHGLNEKTVNFAPAFGSPQFGAALINSRSVLPPTREKNPARVFPASASSDSYENRNSSG